MAEEVAEFHPRNMLITGGAGFIGCNFVRHMLATDSTVRIVNLDALTYAGSLDNLRDLPDTLRPADTANVGARHASPAPFTLPPATTGRGMPRPYKANESVRHIFAQGDICDRALVDKLLRDYHIDTIVHFAAESHVDRAISGPAAFVQTNIVGTFTLLEAARNYWLAEQKWGAEQCRFHHISTDEVYGTLPSDAPAFLETTPYAPNSPYSASKAAADHLVRAYQHTYNLPTTTTNCSNNYGPYQHTEKLIPTVIRSCIEQKPIPIYGNGSNIRDWLYVADHCSGIAAVIHEGRIGETYNIGGCNEWANIDICRLICKLMDELRPQHAPHERLITYVTDRPGHDWRYAIDASKILHELAWRPTETFETGIRKTVAWYLERK